ncbi:restriction endonuclease subunit S [Phocaeicola vulgatus]|uniref:restriction endonuclease subunit S n=1 Tax=Phocaeicola vulgatus TaxID=821 RepID=UPI00321A4BEF
MAIDNKDKKVLNVPPLRFPEFSGEWEEHTLSEYLEFKNGLNPDAKRIGQGLPFISVMDILAEGVITYNSIRGKVEATDKEIDCFGVKNGDLLFQRSSETLEDVGRANVYMDSRTAVYGGFVIRGRKIGNYVPLFFKYLLATPLARKKTCRMGAGAQHFNIGQEGLSKISLSFPSVKEQEKIANLLSLIDERIATQNKIIEKLESLIKGLNDSLYAQYGNDVLTSFSSLGFSYSGLSGKSAQDFGSGKPFITYLNVYSNNIINEKDFQYVAIKDDEKQNVVEYGDVLFTLSSETPEEVGIGSVYLGNENVYLNSFCFGIHIRNTKIAFPPYLSYYVSLTPFRKFIYPYAQGSTRFNLCKADFEKANIKLPSLENQKRIYSILSHIESKTETEKSLLDLYNSQKQHLLRQMFI